MKLPRLSDIDDQLELWRGTKIRLVNNGENLHPGDKYYDYMLALLPWEKENMILVNITDKNHKAGAVYATKVPIEKGIGKMIVKKSGLKKALGPDFDNCFLLL